MSDSVIKPALIKRLARSCCEWGTMAFAMLSVGCFVYWVVSINTSRADPSPLGFGGRLGTYSAKDGFLEARSDWDGDTGRLDEIANFPQLNPGVTADRGFNLPGARFRMLKFGYGDYPDWAIEVSFLILSALWALLTLICFALYRYLRRRTVREKSQQAASSPSSGAFLSP